MSVVFPGRSEGEAHAFLAYRLSISPDLGGCRRTNQAMITQPSAYRQDNPGNRTKQNGQSFYIYRIWGHVADGRVSTGGQTKRRRVCEKKKIKKMKDFSFPVVVVVVVEEGVDGCHVRRVRMSRCGVLCCAVHARGCREN